jgi:hypothetical protein
MTTKSEVLHAAAGKIGMNAKLTVKGGLKVLVKIVDVRVSYGRANYLVEPIAGEGQVWVKQDIEVQTNE